MNHSGFMSGDEEQQFPLRPAKRARMPMGAFAARLRGEGPPLTPGPHDQGHPGLDRVSARARV